MAREDPQLKLRLTEEMKARIVDSAHTNNRSVNSELVARLEQSFRQSEDLNKSEHIRTLQAKLLESYGSENETLKRLSTLNETILLEVAHAISKAAKGDRSGLDKLIELENEHSMFKRIALAPNFED